MSLGIPVEKERSPDSYTRALLPEALNCNRDARAKSYFGVLYMKLQGQSHDEAPSSSNISRPGSRTEAPGASSDGAAYGSRRHPAIADGESRLRTIVRVALLF